MNKSQQITGGGGGGGGGGSKANEMLIDRVLRRVGDITNARIGDITNVVVVVIVVIVDELAALFECNVIVVAGPTDDEGVLLCGAITFVVNIVGIVVVVVVLRFGDALAVNRRRNFVTSTAGSSLFGAAVSRVDTADVVAVVALDFIATRKNDRVGVV